MIRQCDNTTLHSSSLCLNQAQKEYVDCSHLFFEENLENSVDWKKVQKKVQKIWQYYTLIGSSKHFHIKNI